VSLELGGDDGPPAWGFGGNRTHSHNKKLICCKMQHKQAKENDHHTFYGV
jgi:hypothetical protein